MFGTEEPALPWLDARIQSWAAARRASIDPVRLRELVQEFLGPHNRLHSPEAMQGVERSLLAAFSATGWTAALHPFELRDVEGAEDFGWGLPRRYPLLRGANIVAARPGGALENEAVVILAHYDTRRDTPGADDNTASVVAILELARLLANERFQRTVVLALTDMEELLCVGVRPLLDELLAKWRLKGVIVLETLGFTNLRPHSLKLESKPGLLYRTQWERMARHDWAAKFTLVLYQGRSRVLAGQVGAGLRSIAGPESYVLAREPADLPILGPILRLVAKNIVRQFRRSDHVAFWNAHIPAVMITDGADFANPNYHKLSDVPETLDYVRLSQIIGALACTVAVSAELEFP